MLVSGKNVIFICANVDLFNLLAKTQNLFMIGMKIKLTQKKFSFPKIAFVLLVAVCVSAKPKPDVIAYSAPLVAAPLATSSAVVSREFNF